MEVKNTCQYDFNKSLDRLDSYLNRLPDFKEAEIIPARSSLTFDNGYYVNCYAVFVDIRESSKLPELHQKRVLSKIYRCYISELVAILQSKENCKEVNIVGDCVSGIFYDDGSDCILQPFQAASAINSIVNILNYKLKKKDYEEIKIGIGIAKGKALMVKAGYNGSGLNDVVWMGDVVNEASHLCNIANKYGNDVIVISKLFYDGLSGYKDGRTKNELIQNWFKSVCINNYTDCYTSDIIRIDMNDWLSKKEYGI